MLIKDIVDYGFQNNQIIIPLLNTYQYICESTHPDTNMVEHYTIIVQNRQD